MFFGFASRFEDKMYQIPDHVEAVIFDFSNVLYMDQSGAYTFQDALHELYDRGITVVISDIHDRKYKLLEGIGVIPHLIDDRHIFMNVERALHWLNQPGHIEDDMSHEEELYIPPVFSPNGDGIDDYWEIKNIHRYPNCKVMVYTKTNIVVFDQQGGYRSPWDDAKLPPRTAWPKSVPGEPR